MNPLTDATNELAATPSAGENKKSLKYVVVIDVYANGILYDSILHAIPGDWLSREFLEGLVQEMVRMFRPEKPEDRAVGMISGIFPIP